MSRAEIRDFLHAIEWVSIGTLDAQGAPQGEVAPAVFRDDKLYISLAPGSAAQTNLIRDARICCAADVFPTYYEIRGATLHGQARPVPDAESRLVQMLQSRATSQGLPFGPVYVVPLTEDSFGFDFSKIKKRL